LVIAVVALKVMTALFTQIVRGSDLFNWITGASLVLADLESGRLPSVPSYGAYTGIYTLLAPFYWLWSILPIQHPPLNAMIESNSPSAVSLNFLMRFPILLFDLLAGFLIYHLVRLKTGSSRKGGVAFCGWYLNPYNIYWTIYWGGYDVIPTAILILAVLFGERKQWAYSGLFLSIAGMLRLFPFLAIPFFLLYAIRDNIRSALRFCLSSFLLLVAAFLAQVYVTGSYQTVLLQMIAVPMKQDWLVHFYGFALANTLFKLTPFLLLTQLYLTNRYWRTSSLMHLTTAFLLILMMTSVSGISYHFIWVTPFLAAYYALDLNGLGLLALTFLSACLYPPLVGLNEIEVFRPLFAGCLYGLEAAYLLKLNLEGSQLHILRFFKTGLFTKALD